MAFGFKAVWQPRERGDHNTGRREAARCFQTGLLFLGNGRLGVPASLNLGLSKQRRQ